MQAFVDRFKAKASKARQAQMPHEDGCRKMAVAEVPVDEQVAPIRLPQATGAQSA